MSDICESNHQNVICLNQYEFIRKYRCLDCNEVMMCSCDEDFGKKFLPHQLDRAVELETQDRIPVTIGFQKDICPECRGLPAISAPKSPIPGATSKIKRYYWREIFFEEKVRYAAWEENNPNASKVQREEEFEKIKKIVLDDIKYFHKKSPKFTYNDVSQAEVFEKYHVDVEGHYANYAKDSDGRARIMLKDSSLVLPEDFIANIYEEEGWSSFLLESVPIHALFGVMMWLLIQDAADPKARMVFFGSRTAFDNKVDLPPIHTFLPEDFGSPGYANRRCEAIERHFELLIPDRACLLDCFDYWLDYSEDFRQYLWAHRERDVAKARMLIERLSPDIVVKILRYLVNNYWGHYLGWPDLFLWREEEFIFIEVKSSSDRLSEDQKRWIKDNYTFLKLPFRLAKIHKSTS